MLLGSPHEAVVRELLASMGDVCLAHLATTATNGRIHATSVQECMEVILLHTADVTKLFSYRRVTSQKLFQYLHQQKVAVGASSTKYELIQATQDYWAERLKGSKQDVLPATPHNTMPCTTTPITPPPPTVSATPPPTASNTVVPNTVPVQHHPLTTVVPNTVPVQHHPLTTVVPNTVPVQHHPLTTVVRSDVFARMFSEWFYGSVNKLQPVCANEPGLDFAPSGFLANTSAEVYLIDLGQNTLEKRARGQQDVYGLLKGLFLEHGLLFSPNYPDGVQAQKTDHGLVRVFVCGTLHKDNSFMGIFEQEFGVVFCPVDKMWKIAYTKLNLKQSSCHTKPITLPPAEIFEITQQ